MHKMGHLLIEISVAADAVIACILKRLFMIQLKKFWKRLFVIQLPKQEHTTFASKHAYLFRIG